MRILHTSDWHLGRIFHGLHLLDDQALALEQVMAAAREYRVDLILIAGDIYDRSVPPTEAVNLLDETLQQMVLQLKIPVVLISGNHDNPDRLNFGQALFASSGLYVYGQVTRDAKPLVLQDAFGDVYICPLPYCEPLTAWGSGQFGTIPEGWRPAVVTHGTWSGRDGGSQRDFTTAR